MHDALPPPGYLTARDAQRALQISAGALRNLVYRGKLKPAGGTPRHPWYHVDDVAAYNAERQKRKAT